MKKTIIASILCIISALLIDVYAQNIPVSVYVQDLSGQPIGEASVVVKGTNNGTTTDASGRCTISCPPNAILVVSYIGYETQEVPVNGSPILVVTLLESQ